jgi:hypothetical protein
LIPLAKWAFVERRGPCYNKEAENRGKTRNL